MLELPDLEFEIAMINTLRALIEKVGSMQNNNNNNNRTEYRRNGEIIKGVTCIMQISKGEERKRNRRNI